MGTHPIFESDFDCLTEVNDRHGRRAHVLGISPTIVKWLRRERKSKRQPGEPGIVLLPARLSHWFAITNADNSQIPPGRCLTKKRVVSKRKSVGETAFTGGEVRCEDKRAAGGRAEHALLPTVAL